MFDLDYVIFRPHNVLRRTAEHRGPVPQRGRDLHEPDPPGQAYDRFRGWRSNARVQLYRRHGSDAGGCDPDPACLQPGVQHRRRSALQRQRTRRNGRPGYERSNRRSYTCRRRNEVQDAYSSHDKVRRVFGERPLHSLEQGLCAMAEWVKRHGARTSKKFNGIEITKNFPQAWLGS